MKLLKLKDVCSVNSGISPPKDKKIFENGTVPFYKTLDVGRIKIGNISDSELKVSQAFADSKKVFEPGTILFPKSGASTLLNHRVVIQKKGLVASTLAAIVPIKDLCLSKYLYYYLLTIDAKDFIPESFYPGMKISEISEIPIPVPSLQEQEKIVERMDKLEKRNTELYKIYKEQLLDLKNLSEEYLNKSFSKMNKNLTPLQLSTINVTDGSHNPAKGVDKSNYMMLSSKNVIDDELNFEKPRYLKKEDFLLENKRTNLEVNDVLLTIVGTIGKTAVVKNLEHNITFQRSVCVIKPNKEILNSYYLKYFLDSIKSFLEKNARGVAQKGIYLNQIREINIPLMDLDRQVQLVTEIEKVQNLIKEITKKKNEQILKQEQIKKSILNKEFSYE